MPADEDYAESIRTALGDLIRRAKQEILMPKHFKKPKGVEAHQHFTGEDFGNAEPWVQDAIAQGRLVVDAETVQISIAGILLPVADTNWIVLENETGGLLTMSDQQFQDNYEQGGGPPAPLPS